MSDATRIGSQGDDGTSADPNASRRRFIAGLAVLGGGGALTSALAQAATSGTTSGALGPAAASVAGGVNPRNVTSDTIAEAEKLAGIAFTDPERAQIARSIDEHLAWFRSRASLGALENARAPAQVFRVLLPGESVRTGRVDAGAEARPADGAGEAASITSATTPVSGRAPSDDDLDFATVGELGTWLRAGHVTSRRLVERSLARIARANPRLFHVVTPIRDPALAEADARDAEARAGRFRGPLHGIPYGLKDIVDTAGIATTWGAEPWRDRVPARDATIVTRLREAGAVCVAKTAVGALAYGDVWFGGTCRNPWNPDEGSSGSSAGSASAVAAGCVPFAIGSETLGSILSPCERCATTGLRPTFGRVPRDGAMALCWSWDKIGPIARSVADAALVLEAIAGANDLDPSSVPDAVVPRFAAPGRASGRGLQEIPRLRLAYDPTWFDGPAAPLRVALEAAEAAGMAVVARPLAPPCDPSVLLVSLMSEAAAAFEDLTRSNADDTLAWQADDAWPNSFRKSWFLPAIELVQAERVRRRFMEWMREALAGVDALVMPPFAGGMLVATNATGHPALALRARDPRRARAGDASGKVEPGPTSIALVGHPFDEATLVAAGAALEARLGVAGIRPDLGWM